SKKQNGRRQDPRSFLQHVRPQRGNGEGGRGGRRGGWCARRPAPHPRDAARGGAREDARRGCAKGVRQHPPRVRRPRALDAAVVAAQRVREAEAGARPRPEEAGLARRHHTAVRAAVLAVARTQEPEGRAAGPLLQAAVGVEEGRGAVPLTTGRDAQGPGLPGTALVPAERHAAVVLVAACPARGRHRGRAGGRQVPRQARRDARREACAEVNRYSGHDGQHRRAAP
ncbi:Hypothetical protein, putative, partial [Bodo saltans]